MASQWTRRGLTAIDTSTRQTQRAQLPLPSIICMSRTAILNAFSPAQELVDPSRFAGRGPEIRELTDALRVQGSIPVVYGDRGLGKSSLAVQMQLIAMGDEELLTSLQAQHLALSERETFLTFYVTCTDQIQSLQDLQLLMVHKLEAIDLISSGPQSKEVLVDRTTRRRLSFKFFESESIKKYTERAERLRLNELTPKSGLSANWESSGKRSGSPRSSSSTSWTERETSRVLPHTSSPPRVRNSSSCW